MAEARPRLIKRQQPHIETLQVSVQVVRIGPKQMTLAVFRQLKKQDLVDLPMMSRILERDVSAFAQAIEDLEHALPGITARHARWQEHAEEIEALPQLFIAV